jgi:hypothetical protein
MTPQGAFRETAEPPLADPFVQPKAPPAATAVARPKGPAPAQLVPTNAPKLKPVPPSSKKPPTDNDGPALPPP